ncbi:MAG: hypothetical protein QGG14_09180 [Planctomycetota bacterium]|jgi:pentose-5-phosphate-3-epimerase|nr:hypothetical protein [Planctomycetota bacterium]
MRIQTESIMHVEAKTKPAEVHITLSAAETYLLRVTLARASYIDTAPEDQEAANQFAEALLRALGGA